MDAASNGFSRNPKKKIPKRRQALSKFTRVWFEDVLARSFAVIMQP